jgi:hypothetical protein
MNAIRAALLARALVVALRGADKVDAEVSENLGQTESST